MSISDLIRRHRRAGKAARRWTRPWRISAEVAAEVRRLAPLGLTQAEIAARAGVSQPTVSRILRKAVTP